MNSGLKFIDLFAGVGGFHLALKDYAQCVFASEWDIKARETYLLNHPLSESINFAGDITQVKIEDIPDFDILCGGFPCQPFSLAGTQKGFEHAQGTLFFDIVKILSAKKPKVLFLENVKNLISHDKGNTFRIILNDLKELGYFVKYQVLNSTEYGDLPQNRERIYIVGFLSEIECCNFSFPTKIELKTNLFENIIDLSDKKSDKYYQTNLDSPSIKKMIEGITQKKVIYQYRRFYMRENKNEVCPTLTANMGTGGHNVPLVLDDFGIRKLTPRECFLIQGFPQDFKFPEKIADNCLYKQAGNSIPVPVVKRIAENIFNAIQNK